jgi:hypothetical protein
MPQNDDHSSQQGPASDLFNSSWRYQIIDLVTRANEGIPYRYVGRCLDRVRWLNLTAGENRYTLKPVRSKE